MSIISEALKKSEVGKEGTEPAQISRVQKGNRQMLAGERHTETKLIPGPKLDAPDPRSRPLLGEQPVDLLADRKFQVPSLLLRWARTTRPWMIWAGMVASLLFAAVFYQWKAQAERKASGGAHSERGQTPFQEKGSDPFLQGKPPKPKQEAPLFRLKKVAEFHLTGISADRVGKIAIINNKIVREGELVDGARVISIKPQEVILERRGERLSRTLY